MEGLKKYCRFDFWKEMGAGKGETLTFFLNPLEQVAPQVWD